MSFRSDIILPEPETPAELPAPTDQTWEEFNMRAADDHVEEDDDMEEFDDDGEPEDGEDEDEDEDEDVDYPEENFDDGY